MGGERVCCNLNGRACLSWKKLFEILIPTPNFYYRGRFFFFTFLSVFLDCYIVVRVFANGPGDLGSFPGRVIPKTLKMVLDTSLLNTQQYKVCIKGKVEQTWERSSALPYTSV